ncbi:MAG TPA: VOC family protein [candidate division Zixibacteria bacterium]|nr:VOC family protein [candidate division Zixibacteria bacterium]
MHSISKHDIFTELHAAVVPVSDMKRSQQFYEDILGLEYERPVNEKMVLYRAGGKAFIALQEEEPDEASAQSQNEINIPCFVLRTDNAFECRLHLLGSGVQCSEIRYGDFITWMTFYDPDHNRIDVCQFLDDWIDI